MIFLVQFGGCFDLFSSLQILRRLSLVFELGYRQNKLCCLTMFIQIGELFRRTDI